MKPHKIYSDDIDEKALEQFRSALDQPYAVKGALMPDAHLGYGLPIGGVVATEGVIVPAWVGYDIGCGMCAVKLSVDKKCIEAYKDAIFAQIYRDVPVGKNKHKGAIGSYRPRRSLTTIGKEIFGKRSGLRQLGTLGSGNHFIEIGYDENGDVWVVIHSGSRGFGHGLATHYMTVAGGGAKPREGHWPLKVDSQDGRDYITDLNYALDYALENRMRMLLTVEHSIVRTITPREYTSLAGFDWTSAINRNHNHAELKDGLWIHRKGATHAEAGMMGVIPGNMRDGSFIVEGKGCEESLSSSSHGAGRVLGRRQAERELKMDDFREAMEGITAKVGESTLDEAPMAYKDIQKVMDNQTELVAIKHVVKPIINIKA